jgi:hypothetical protein
MVPVLQLTFLLLVYANSHEFSIEAHNLLNILK